MFGGVGCFFGGSMAPRQQRVKGVVHITSRSPMKEGRVVLGTFRSERMRVLNRSHQNDRLRVMLVLVHSLKLSEDNMDLLSLMEKPLKGGANKTSPENTVPGYKETRLRKGAADAENNHYSSLGDFKARSVNGGRRIEAGLLKLQQSHFRAVLL
ncbi:hypothetical protein TNCV_916441 [Trichonephila clavipes]|nr:hypothetical protein TNCV_916441 [Trichonephila clavipes]